jgi:hypothetical protein
MMTVERSAARTSADLPGKELSRHRAEDVPLHGVVLPYEGAVQRVGKSGS